MESEFIKKKLVNEILQDLIKDIVQTTPTMYKARQQYIRMDRVVRKIQDVMDKIESDSNIFI
jgi:hypothetical protein